MKCFTLIDDQNPYHGISVGLNDVTGILSNFCTIADGNNIGQRPDIATQNLTNLRIYTPQEGLHGIVEDASVIERVMGREYPVLTAPYEHENSETILIYWAINEQIEGWGPVTRVILSNETNSTVYTKKSAHAPYYEVLFSLALRTAIEIYFASHNKLTVANRRGHPEFIH
jgi:hypothetical protein